MVTNKDIAKLYMCRRCLNKFTKVKFENYELNYKYYYYHSQCSKCDEMSHIVGGVRLRYLWKLPFLKIPKELLPAKKDAAYEKHVRKQRNKKRLKKWLNL